ncbi:hypothetical protein C435_09319 [Haloarcula marismortui ATCC 33799]|uniref:Uncharacterized protein n=1 Tax=Haloarcula marismortui ATCC 33799 TaxID=662475 RepID=M0KAI3_9EURY|nr:hypothetical protein C435_09319 [Haloarcula californiae ATCC 33799]
MFLLANSSRLGVGILLAPVGIFVVPPVLLDQRPSNVQAKNRTTMVASAGVLPSNVPTMLSESVPERVRRVGTDADGTDP